MDAAKATHLSSSFQPLFRLSHSCSLELGRSLLVVACWIGAEKQKAWRDYCLLSFVMVDGFVSTRDPIDTPIQHESNFHTRSAI